LKLVICEKPSKAAAYAAVLGAKKRQDGFLRAAMAGSCRGATGILWSLHPPMLMVNSTNAEAAMPYRSCWKKGSTGRRRTKPIIYPSCGI